jgi:hypothetical protein
MNAWEAFRLTQAQQGLCRRRPGSATLLTGSGAVATREPMCAGPFGAESVAEAVWVDVRLVPAAALRYVELAVGDPVDLIP